MILGLDSDVGHTLRLVNEEPIVTFDEIAQLPRILARQHIAKEQFIRVDQAHPIVRPLRIWLRVWFCPPGAGRKSQ